MPDLLTLVLLGLPLAAALLAAPLARGLGSRAAWLLAAFPAAAFVILCGQADAVRQGAVLLSGFDWIPSYGMRFSFRLDGLSLVFGLLITGIGTLIVLYSGGYLAGHRDLGRFFTFILMFMAAMLGLVLADDLMTLIVYWELTSITSFLLIGFDHERERARRGAIQALVITGGGGLALMAGLVLIREVLGLTSMTEVLAAGDALRDSAWYLPILLLVLGGAFTKSAQMPFHVWLPNAMEAPTPVSAYLHSATMVKAGVYLLMRLNPALGETLLWETILPLFGGVTLVGGALLALRQTDMKLILAYTTVASLGLLVMLIGVGSEAAMEAAVLYLVAHALFKGALFMVAGSVDHGAGSRDLLRLGGLRRAMPITFVAALLAALSMGGVLPFFGFLAKEVIYEATAAPTPRGIALTLTAIAGNALMFAAAFLVALKPFLGQKPAALDHPHEGPALIWLGPLVLGLAGLFTALFSGSTHAWLTSPMASAVIGTPVEITISALPHLGLAFALSMLTLAIGAGLYLVAGRVRSGVDAALNHIGWGPDIGFDQAMRGLLALSFAVTRKLQSGRLDRYMTQAFIVIAAALLVPMVLAGALPAIPAMPQLSLSEWAVSALLVIGVLSVVIARSRLTAIVSLGIQGIAVALLFILLGAPDLSFTQFMIETLSVVILALVMTRLKLEVEDRRPLRETLIDAAVAAAAGIGIGLLLLRVTQVPFDPVMSDFFTRYSYAIAHGRNIVNVIIVDFRGMDTLGEIAVVMVTGLAILALIRIRVGKPRLRTADPTEATP
ncbi:Na(+)/H(+) antiporter subunit A [Aureimonas sp. SA4125]|uniref:putative monovalent cation/H+ antiporter subunit A n=1 Tax=Aureimonas sp. SA4125 TaxID=2826993 RepID=UPI001CC5F8AF|nr:putative monovalent cation/H+ antiporter subunit A [Aureimonas sp. SA4125]BDA85991.1 Na(+)/H(+) antiporter subunit A [Aureimonas sp. SA4125]